MIIISSAKKSEKLILTSSTEKHVIMITLAIITVMNDGDICLIQAKVTRDFLYRCTEISDGEYCGIEGLLKVNYASPSDSVKRIKLSFSLKDGRYRTITIATRDLRTALGRS